jgi:hypothetical protein
MEAPRILSQHSLHAPSLTRALAGCALAITLATFVSFPAGAQTHPNLRAGLDQYSYSAGDIDSINLYNGNLTVTIPIGNAYPVSSAFSYAFSLVYNSNPWDLESDGDRYPSPHNNAGFGWRVSLGTMFNPLSPPYNDESLYLLVEPDGTRRVFFETLHPGDANDPSGVLYTRDGSYLRLTLDEWSSGDLREGIVESPDGLVRVFRKSAPGGSGAARLETIADAWGNDLAVTYGANTQTFTDQHGRAHTITFDGTTGLVTRVDLAAFAGARALYDFGYDTYLLDGHVVQVLRWMSTPDSNTWQMDYYKPDDELFLARGLLMEVKLPTKGRFRYGYALYARGTGDPLPQHLKLFIGVTKREYYHQLGATSAFAVWSYDPAPTLPAGESPGPNEGVTKVTTPLGASSYHYFWVVGNGDDPADWRQGLPFSQSKVHAQESGHPAPTYLSVQVLEGSAQKRAQYVRYTADEPSGNGLAGNQRLTRSRTYYLDDGSKWKDLALSDFDGLGHYRTVTQSSSPDWPGGGYRQTTTAFNPSQGSYEYDAMTGVGPSGGFQQISAASPWVLGTFTQRSLSDGGATAIEEHCFSAQGFLQAHRALAGPTRASNDVLRVFQADANGADVKRELWYGSDPQPIATGSHVCGLSPPASSQLAMQYDYSRGSVAAMHYLSASGGSIFMTAATAAIDSNTGLASSVWDSSGLRTDFEYDALGRTTRAKPQAGGGAWVYHTYTPATTTSKSGAAMVQTQAYRNGLPTLANRLSNEILRADALGRVRWEEVTDSSSTTNVRETLYNQNGWLSSRSEWSSTAWDTSRRTRYQTYDPFGRPRTIKAPHGSAPDDRITTVSYIGDRQATVTRTVKTGSTSFQPATTTRRFDGLGRLWQVVEPSGVYGDFVTTYSFDVGSRLSGVLQEHQSFSSTSQSRTFVYDNRGFLLREQHPELGAAGNGWQSHCFHDAAGKVLRQRMGSYGPGCAAGSGPFDLELAYDRAERPVQVANGSQVLKSFAYYGAGVAPPNRHRLQTASRHNPGLNLGLGLEDVVVTEDYTWNGPGGLLSDLTTTVSRLAGVWSFGQSWGYSDLGQVVSEGYPLMTAGTGGVYNAAPARTVARTYVNGQQTSIPGYAEVLQYHDNFMLERGKFAPDHWYYIGKADDQLQRPSLIATATDTQVLLPGIAYEYDPSGNVTKVGDSSFWYQTTGRIRYARMGNGAQQTTPTTASGT